MGIKPWASGRAMRLFSRPLDFLTFLFRPCVYLLFFFSHFIYPACVSLCLCGVFVLSLCLRACACRSQRTAGGSQFCLFTVHIVEMERRLAGLAGRGFMCSHTLSAAVCWLEVCRSFVVWVFLFGLSC